MSDLERRKAKLAGQRKKIEYLKTILAKQKDVLQTVLLGSEPSRTIIETAAAVIDTSVNRHSKDYEAYLCTALETFEGDELIESQNFMQETEDLMACCESLKKQAQAKLGPSTTTVAADNSQNNPEILSSVKLPKISLPNFDGNILQFAEFWEAFQTVHNNENLEDTNKFHYLMGLLEGPAKDLLIGMSKTSANYHKAIETLQKRFGNTEQVALAHFEALDKLPKPNETWESLKIFRDKYEMHQNSLLALDYDFQACKCCKRTQASFLWKSLPSLIQDKLSNKLPEEGWTLPTLLEALNYEIRRCETMGPSKPRERGHMEIVKSDPRKYSKPTWKKPDYEMKKPRTTVVNTCPVTSGGPPPCEFCGSQHPAHNCRTYQTREARIQRVKGTGRCFKCLAHGHRATECSQGKDIVCKLCRKMGHHAAFCDTQWDSQASSHDFKKRNETAKNVGMVLSVNNQGGSVALPTALVKIKKGSRFTRTRALLDQGAQQTFICKDVAKGCVETGTRVMKIDGFRSKGKPEELQTVDVNIATENKVVTIEAVVVDSMPENVSVTGEADIEKELRAKGRKLADDSTVNYKIGLLIGADNYYKFVTPQVKVGDQILIPSILGDLKSGPTNPIKSSSSAVTVLKIGVEAQRDIDCLWDLDAIGIHSDEAHPDDKLALKEFNSSIRYENGSYVARLPWKAGHAPLPDNLTLAKKRLAGNLKKLKADPENDALNAYDSIIQDQLQRNFIEKVKPSQEPVGEHCHYLAHHAVKKDSSTTPIRIVFDCSAKMSSELPSLNDCLYSGPAMVPELTQILVRFRTGPYAASADIAKAYLMIGLDEKDRDATRFLWPEDVHDPDSQLSIYRFKAILFGATCSQFILNATIDRHLEMNREAKPTTAEILKDSIYVDNLLISSPTEKALVSLYDESKEVLGSAGLHLREWASNVQQVRDSATALEEADPREVVPLLGLRWDTNNDTLSLARRELDPSPPTKRNVLSSLAKQFDPLGLMTPITIKTKMMVKEMWESKIDWDDELPERMQAEWEHLKTELEGVHEIQLPRQLHSEGKITLHAFVDASTKAYGAVVYGVQNNFSNLIMTKGRIAPSKKLTITKLELTAATLGSRLIKYVREALGGKVEISEIHLWSDSNVALGWIHANSPLEAYVQNRKIEIAQNVPDAKWHYVPTGLNPADKITRGVTLAKLRKDEMWWHGPEMIRTQDQWEEISPPKAKNYTALPTLIDTKQQEKEPSMLLAVSERCSKLKKVIRVMIFIRRFISNLKNRCAKKPVPAEIEPSALEYESTKRWLFKKLQEESFEEELQYLKSEKPVRKHPPPLVRTLRLGLRDDLIVCDSRLARADIDDSAKYPILLPSKHRITKLLIEDIHRERQHIGVNSTVATIRQCWWIPKGRQRVKQVIKDCVVCKKERCLPYAVPPIPPLPAVRVSMTRPFAVVGVDYGGPLLIRKGKERNQEGELNDEKRYFALFTCAATRAIHLDLVPDLSAEAFLRALQRFCAKWSYPSVMLSDNGTNFVASAEILQSWERNAAVRQHLNHKGCKWHFIPGRAPWFGGFWERMIGLTKRSLAKALGRSLVTEDVLRTVLSEIEAQINDRPLTTTSDNVDDLQPLTPSMLTLGHRLDSVPVPVIDPAEERDPSYNEKKLLTQRQKHAQKTKEHYCTRWYNEYLTELRRAEDDVRKGKLPEVGEVVQIKDEGNRLLWKIGIIVKLQTSPDGHIRSCSVRTANGVITRPVKTLYPLEVGVSMREAFLDDVSRDLTPGGPERKRGSRTSSLERGTSGDPEVSQKLDNSGVSSSAIRPSEMGGRRSTRAAASRARGLIYEQANF